MTHNFKVGDIVIRKEPKGYEVGMQFEILGVGRTAVFIQWDEDGDAVEDIVMMEEFCEIFIKKPKSLGWFNVRRESTGEIYLANTDGYDTKANAMAMRFSDDKYVCDPIEIFED